VISLADDLAGRRGVIVAGAASGRGEAVDEVARALGWPVLATPPAPVWAVPGATVPAADALLRTALADELRPELVVHLGGPLASRVVGEWLAAADVPQVVVAGDGRWVDPHGTATVVLATDPGEQLVAWLRELSDVRPVDDGAWRARWDDAGGQAAAAITAALADAEGHSEPEVARAVVGALPDGAHLVISSSMPIRDVEWYVAGGRPLDVYANRGTNGIDGVVSTAVGIGVATGELTALLIGDLAFLHDSNGLLGAPQRSLDLVIVVVDNDGGGIFSFLPQADPAAVPADMFEVLYGTPHGLDLVALASAYGARARLVADGDDLGAAVEAAVAAGGVEVLVVRTDRAANVELHRRLNAAVASAVTPDTG
jgi:2-succinyl-5-enolpyruvyl-6-hydroxy-3-cyclohexene-1-carboxylate synthase